MIEQILQKNPTLKFILLKEFSTYEEYLEFLSFKLQATKYSPDQFALALMNRCYSKSQVMELEVLTDLLDIECELRTNETKLLYVCRNIYADILRYELGTYGR